jgi:hypothetical protein
MCKSINVQFFFPKIQCDHFFELYPPSSSPLCDHSEVRVLALQGNPPLQTIMPPQNQEIELQAIEGDKFLCVLQIVD